MIAKILMQDIWRAGTDWDDVLPSDLISMWKSWASDLTFISTLKIPRCFRRLIKPINYELHAFSDASEAGFSACIYLRTE